MRRSEARLRAARSPRSWWSARAPHATAAHSRRPCPELRAFKQRKRCGWIEPAVVEGSAGDGAGKLPRPRGQQRAHVLDRSQSAGCDHGDRNLFGKCDGGVEVEALEHAVTSDVGVDDGGDAGILEALGDIERAEL